MFEGKKRAWACITVAWDGDGIEVEHFATEAEAEERAGQEAKTAEIVGGYGSAAIIETLIPADQEFSVVEPYDPDDCEDE